MTSGSDCCTSPAARLTAALALAAVLAACASPDADRPGGDADSTVAADTANGAAGPSASVPPVRIPDDFETAGGRKVYDARRAFDFTGDGRPETIVVHTEGEKTDSADVELLVLSATADTLYRDSWNTRFYFQYEYRNTFSDSAAHAKVLSHLKPLLADTMFTTDGPSKLMSDAYPGGVDPDAVLYDLKDEVVRKRHGLRQGEPFRDPSLHDEVSRAQVADSSVDSLVAELKKSPTFRYYAGGEVSYTIAWSPSRQRMIRTFSCC